MNKLTTPRTDLQTEIEPVSDGGSEPVVLRAVAGQQLIAELRSWGKWLLGFGIVNLIFSAFSGPFGVLLLLVGLASFYLHSRAMFVVLGVTMSWAALSNIITVFSGGGAGGLFWFAIQIWLAYKLFHQFSEYRQHEQDYLEKDSNPAVAEPGRSRAERLMPWAAGAVGLLAPLGFGTIFLATVVWIGLTGQDEPPAFVGLSLMLSAEIGVLGFALGLACWLTGFRYKLLHLIGMAGGLLTVLVVFSFALWP